MKKSILIKYRVLSAASLVAFLVVVCPSAQAQTKNNNHSANKKYVRMDIGHGALHCPFLSPKLETELKAIKGIDNYFIDKKTSYATFCLPANTDMTVESLKKIGIDVGYPADDVMVILDNKPIKTSAKPE